MPSTPLTKILHEFRAYRPLPHREFLGYINSKAAELDVRNFAVQDTETTVLLLKTLNHVRSFRWRHWLFAREYIIKRTPHPTATGGSPIVTVCFASHFPWLCGRELANVMGGVVASESAIRRHGSDGFDLR
jgi:hypothetical protein